MSEEKQHRDMAGPIFEKPIRFDEKRPNVPAVICRNCGATWNLLNPFGPRSVESCEECDG